MSTVARDLGPYLEDHIAAMIEAASPADAAVVLASAESKYLGGQRVYCTAHQVEMAFPDLLRHTRHHHELGDVVPADPDPRELGRGGETAVSR